jgi:anaerobic selenocysteine-containing dehydrogenase
VEVEIENGRLTGARRKSLMPPESRLQCPKLLAAADIVYSPNRITTPLVREKGSPKGVLREASWDEALDLVAERFLYFKKEYGPQSVCWLRGMAADWGALWDYANRLMSSFGSPNCIGNGSVCHVTRDMAHVYTYGAMTMPQSRNARCILVWGKNDLNTAPPAFEAIMHARQQGARLIVIDPIKTPLAAMADIWLQVKPGHDGLLAMAMIHELIENELYDAAFVREFTLGFEELKTAAARYPMEKVAPEIWLDPNRVKEAVRVYATTRPACIVDGNGLDMHVHAFQTTRAVCLFRALSGNLDLDGGDFIPQPVPLRNIQLKDRLPPDVPPVTRDYPLFNEFHPTWGLHVQSCVVDAILEEKPYPLKMLVVQSGNPAVSMMDSNRVKRSLDKLDFLVMIDLFRNETSRFADVILPAGSCFENTQLNRAGIRNNPVILQNEVIDWVGQSRPNWKIMFDLAGRLGLEREFPWRTAEEAIDYQLEPSGITVEMLRKNPGGVRAEELRYEKHKTSGFATPSGKVELFSERLRRNGQPPIPFMDGVFQNPISFADANDADALIGMSGERTNRFTNTQFYNIESLLKEEPQGRVDLHPDDARRRDIVEGDWVKLETPRGQVRMKAGISEVVRPGAVQIAWGYGEVEPELSLNNLTDDDRRDPVTGTPSGRSFMCRVERIDGYTR